jgi:HTH-type transcriptional regulator / antitoxin HipB
MNVMSDTIRFPSDIGAAFKRLRKQTKLSGVKACELAGKSRDTLYRFERGEDASLQTTLAFLGTIGHTLAIVKKGRPTLEEMQKRFAEGADDDE